MKTNKYNFRGSIGRSKLRGQWVWTGVLLTATLFGTSLGSWAQTSTIGNSTGSPDFLGWDTGQNFPLILQHEGPRPMIFSVDNVPHFSINEDGGINLGSPSLGNTVRLLVSSGTNNAVNFLGTSSVTVPGNAYGAYFFCSASSEQDRGLSGYAQGSNNGNEYAGALGYAANGDVLNAGIYGQACAGSDAAYFNGDLMVTGILDGPSDENLKEQITSLDDSTIGLLDSVNVYSYNYQSIEGLHLSEGEQFGFLAQEVQEIFPNVVKEFTVPDRYSEEGELLTESISHLSVDYNQFLALALNRYQQQDAAIKDNLARLEDLKSQLQTLQAKSNAPNDDQQAKKNAELTESLTLFPNPASGNVNVSFSAKSNRPYRLIVTDVHGKVMHEANLGRLEGFVTYELKTSQMKPGYYIVDVSNDDHQYSSKFLKN